MSQERENFRRAMKVMAKIFFVFFVLLSLASLWDGSRGPEAIKKEKQVIQKPRLCMWEKYKNKEGADE